MLYCLYNIYDIHIKIRSALSVTLYKKGKIIGISKLFFLEAHIVTGIGEALVAVVNLKGTINAIINRNIS